MLSKEMEKSKDNMNATKSTQFQLTEDQSEDTNLKETSTFGDSSCGEPLVPQHLVLDFTPNDKDTDFIQKKICDFWDFIRKCPEIRHLEVIPVDMRNTYFYVATIAANFPPTRFNKEKVPDARFDTGTEAETNSTCSEFGPEPDLKVDKTAISVLELAEEGGFLNSTFANELPRSTCTLGSRAYNEDIKPNNGYPFVETAKVPCPVKTTAEAKELHQTLTEWDLKHPKSMQPPGHPPSLQHAVMQRFNEPPKPVDFDSKL